jgi:hypothetical protein
MLYKLVTEDLFSKVLFEFFFDADLVPMFESEVVHNVMKWSDKKNVTIVSIYRGSEDQAIIKKGEGKQKLV